MVYRVVAGKASASEAAQGRDLLPQLPVIGEHDEHDLTIKGWVITFWVITFS